MKSCSDIARYVKTKIKKIIILKNALDLCAKNLIFPKNKKMTGAEVYKSGKNSIN